MAISSLSSQYISASFQNLVQVSASGELFTGNGTQITNLILTSVTASLLGTVSNALTASYYGGTVISASYALTASYALNGGGGGSVNTGSLLVTASVADNTITFTKGDGSTFPVTIATGSVVVNINTSSFATTGSNVFKDTQTISGSILISGSIIPATDGVSTTSSFSLGSPTAAWKDIWVSNGTINFIDGAGNKQSSIETSADGLKVSGSLRHGLSTNTVGLYSHAEGYASSASGLYSHAEGDSSQAIGDSSHAEGLSTQANGDYSHAEGSYAIANGDYSHAEGSATAQGAYSHAEGSAANSQGDYSHAEGYGTSIGIYSHAEGRDTITYGLGSHAEGNSTKAIREDAHAEGYGTASGLRAHSEGYATSAAGVSSHTEGYQTRTGYISNYINSSSGDPSNPLASSQVTIVGNYANNFLPLHNVFILADDYSYLNYDTIYSSSYNLSTNKTTVLFTTVITGSFIGYLLNESYGTYAHAEGQQTTATGYASHAEGYITIALGDYSHAEGIYTIASGSGQTVVGKYNKRGDSNSLFTIGNGIGDSDANRSDIVNVTTSNVQITGSLDVTQGITGSLLGTASNALTASYLLGSIESASYAPRSFSFRLQFTGTNPADATTYYFATLGLQPTVDTAHKYSIPLNSMLQAASVTTYTSTTATSEASSVYVRKNNTTDTLLSNDVIFGLSLSTTSSYVNGLNTTFNQGDQIQIKWVTPTWSTNPTSCGMFVDLHFVTT